MHSDNHRKKPSGTGLVFWKRLPANIKARKNKAGDWKNHFDDYLKALFKEKVGQFLVQEGYENDLDW